MARFFKLEEWIGKTLAIAAYISLFCWLIKELYVWLTDVVFK
jgi:hypothetical protein